MSQYVESPPERTTAQSPQVSGWVGWIAFAGVLMVVLGSFHTIQGLVALLDDSYYLVESSRLIISVDYSQWGWVQLVFGLVIVVAGVCVFAGQIWARVVGTIMAALSAIVNVGFLAAYPAWCLVMIALDVVVIMALTVHGSDIKPGQF